MLSSDTLGGSLHRFVNGGVAGAAAEVAADRLCDLVTRRTRVRVEQRLRGEQHPRRAVAALGGALFGERGLQRMQLRSVRHPLDREDLSVADLEREREAGEHRDPIDQYGARAALAELAAMLRPRERELLAEHLEQRVVRLRRDGMRLAVHTERQQCLRHADATSSAVFAPSRRDSALAALAQRSPMRRSVRRSMRCLKPTTMTNATVRPRASTIGAAAARTPAKSSSSS